MQVTNAVPDRLRSITSTMLNRFRRSINDARTYVGTDDVSGQLQFELLKREGCIPGSKVLEVGCGCLSAGIHLIRFLDRRNYVGIDPNEWLRQAALRQSDVQRLVEEKEAKFLSGLDFDASRLGIKFDRVLSHSVLSHAAYSQLELFLRNVTNVLAPDGRILASIRLAEGNSYGSTGTPNREDSREEEWVYPGVSWFKLSTVKDAASKLGLTATLMPEYTEYYTRTRPGEYHDWVVFYRK